MKKIELDWVVISSFLYIVQLGLLAMRLHGVITISWILVFIPAIINIAIMIGLFISSDYNLK